MIVNCCVGIMQSVCCCVGVLLLVNCCVVELVKRLMAPFLGVGQPFRWPRNGLIDGCEEGGGRNWMGSCGRRGTGHRRDFHAFLYFLVDRELGLGARAISGSEPART